MALTVSNNSAVATASYYLGKNQSALQSSIKKLASGKKLVDASADPGTLSVAMKVRASINRLSGAQNNIQNGIGFLEVQDGLLDTVGKIVMRMSELKGFASQDPMKGEQDIASYNNEFKDLQVQLYQVSQLDFNGMSLFANHTSKDAANASDYTTAWDSTVANWADQPSDQPGKQGEALFGGADQLDFRDNTISIFTSSEGSDGPKVSIHKSLLLSALTIRMDRKNAGEGQGTATDVNQTADGYWSDVYRRQVAEVASAGSVYQDHGAGQKDWEAWDESKGINPNNENAWITLAAVDQKGTLTLDKISAGVFETAIENVTFLRAQTGGGMSRLNFAAESIAMQETNMRSALGRIEDVDMAKEASNLAKYSILMQASAAMVAQANSTSQVALMLLQV
jgi:flagellin